ncbi:hypothetical protein HUT06_04295 [Actinomadura sp. NAK00032]|uniref:hypothetical protein n=1 Tax=Actinomadura sp. NAK00032 TaxID=2742128 RepID=UPI00158FEA50|nr:hypothetical protein [Actinomadura sp. NAK00032]QKW33346.1 hypothetical protein HUT06_04295 [Actinomadura sp. NAK00032]
MSSPAKPLSPAHAERESLPRFFGLMKATTAFLATALLVQGITAGQILADEDGGSQLHDSTGPAVTAALILQTIAAALVWRVGRGSGRYLAVTGLLLVFTAVQFVVGGRGDLAVHVPLGVALFGAGAVLMTQVWTARPGAGRGTPM